MNAVLKIGSVEQKLWDGREKKRANFAVLLDPDSQSIKDFLDSGARAVEGGADLLMVGGSFMGNPKFTDMVSQLKSQCAIPVVLFPGGASQVQAGPDAILFTSLVSGRNPQYLIEHQIRGGMFVKALGMEAIPTAYCLIDGGRTTAVEYISDTRPIPADKPKLTMATAIASELMGMRWIYLEAGSGAQNPVPLDHVKMVRHTSNLGVIVGGGIVNPEMAVERVKAGADVIVTGNIWEKCHDVSLLKEFAQAIHGE